MSAQRQREAVRRADAVAAAADSAVLSWWRELLRLIDAAPRLGPRRLHAMATVHFRRLPYVAQRPIQDGLTGLWHWGHETAARAVPVEALRRAARGRYALQNQQVLSGSTLPNLRAVSARAGRRSATHQTSGHGILLGANRLLSERASADRGAGDGVSSAGAIAELMEDRSPLLDRLFGLTSGGIELPDPSRLPEDLLRQLILPSPPETVIRRRVDELIAPFLAAPRPDLVSPERLADILIRGYAEGKTQQQIAKDLLPHVDGVKASARRVARTWGIHVAGESQMQAHEALGDLVIGYTIHATPGPYSRWWHQDRDGTTYYKQPGPGQKGMAQMPRPPREAPDPSERPLGAPAIAWQ